jgi:hypothetical protein
MFSATAARKNCSRTNFNLRRRRATQFDLILEFREQEFGNDSGKHTQWRAFLRRSALTQTPENRRIWQKWSNSCGRSLSRFSELSRESPHRKWGILLGMLVPDFNAALCA